jgi:PPOX class probable F420-dependent enzyme
LVDRKTESTLKKDLVVWFCTVGADSRPHATLVWFLWEGDSFLIYSIPGQKVRDIQGNSNVELLLNSDPAGAEMVRASGTAKIVRSQTPATKVPAYMRKYRQQIKDLGGTPEQFAEHYRVAIRVRPVRFH